MSLLCIISENYGWLPSPQGNEHHIVHRDFCMGKMDGHLCSPLEFHASPMSGFPRYYQTSSNQNQHFRGALTIFPTQLKKEGFADPEIAVTRSFCSYSLLFLHFPFPPLFLFTLWGPPTPPPPRLIH